MGLKVWTLDKLTAWIGILAILTLFVPMGVYLVHSISSAAEQDLAKYGKSLIDTLAGQIIEPVLLGDQIALHIALQKAIPPDSEIRYLCIEDGQGGILAGTMAEGFPQELLSLWRERPGEVVFFRTEEGPVMDISTHLMGGQLGTLHAGISRSRATRTADRLFWLMGIALVITLSVVLVGARIIMISVGKPLRQLEAAVSTFPQRTIAPGDLEVTGTQEVESLARVFGDMVGRLELLEGDRAATQERLIHTERLAALGELAAGLAHEVHNPLDGMQECLRFLQRDPGKSERAEKYYPMLSEGLERIARVMRGTLTFARLGQHVSVEAVRIADVMKASRLLVQANIKDRSVDLNWQLPGNCECLCDSQGFAQVLLNLVLNAADAAQGSDKQQVRIESKCDRQWVYVSIEDSGPGVSQELRSRIFEPFFTTKAIGEGTGLGLSVSQQLIRAVGGELKLSPEPSSLGGARFTIRLPKAQPCEECYG